MTPSPLHPNAPTCAHAALESRLNVAWILGALVFIVALTLYVATMCRTVFWWDTGELAANIRILGIPHRPGFPLYVLVGRVFTLAPFGEFFYRINFLSAASAAAAAGVFAYVWFGLIATAIRPRRLWESVGAVAVATISVGGTYTLWMQAVRAEVYAPTLLCLALLIGCAWGADRAVRREDTDAGRWLCAAALVAGLGLGLHHATFASALPAVALFFVVLQRRRPFGLRLWLVGLILFLLGVSVYLYLPLRAGQGPLLNWGWTPHVPSPGWGSVVASDALGSVAAASVVEVARRAWLSLALLIDQLHWGLIALAGWGLITWWRTTRRWAVLAIGIIIGNLLVTALLVSDFSDTNTDIHGYLLPALAALGMCLSGGLASVLRNIPFLLSWMRTPGLRRILVGAGAGTLALFAMAPTVVYAPYCNLVSNRLAYDLGTEATAELKPDAVVFVAATNLDFVLRGLQFCDGWRRDLRVLNCDLMPAAWYREGVFSRFPDLADVPIPRDSSRLHLEEWAIALARAGYPVYWEFTETDMEMIPNLVPAGHFFAVSATPVLVLGAQQIRTQEEFEERSQFYNSPAQIRYDYDAQRVYVMNLYRAGMYYESRGYVERARALYQRALSLLAGDFGGRRSPAGRRLGVTDSVKVRLDSGAGLDPSAVSP